MEYASISKDKLDLIEAHLEAADALGASGDPDMLKYKAYHINLALEFALKSYVDEVDHELLFNSYDERGKKLAHSHDISGLVDLADRCLEGFMEDYPYIAEKAPELWEYNSLRFLNKNITEEEVISLEEATKKFVGNLREAFKRDNPAYKSEPKHENNDTSFSKTGFTNKNQTNPYHKEKTETLFRFRESASVDRDGVTGKAVPNITYKRIKADLKAYDIIMEKCENSDNPYMAGLALQHLGETVQKGLYGINQAEDPTAHISNPHDLRILMRNAEYYRSNLNEACSFIDENAEIFYSLNYFIDGRKIANVENVQELSKLIKSFTQVLIDDYDMANEQKSKESMIKSDDSTEQSDREPVNSEASGGLEEIDESEVLNGPKTVEESEDTVNFSKVASQVSAKTKVNAEEPVISNEPVIQLRRKTIPLIDLNMMKADLNAGAILTTEAIATNSANMRCMAAYELTQALEKAMISIVKTYMPQEYYRKDTSGRYMLHRQHDIIGLRKLAEKCRPDLEDVWAYIKANEVDLQEYNSLRYLSDNISLDDLMDLGNAAIRIINTLESEALEVENEERRDEKCKREWGFKPEVKIEIPEGPKEQDLSISGAAISDYYSDLLQTSVDTVNILLKECDRSSNPAIINLTAFHTVELASKSLMAIKKADNIRVELSTSHEIDKVLPSISEIRPEILKKYPFIETNQNIIMHPSCLRYADAKISLDSLKDLASEAIPFAEELIREHDDNDRVISNNGLGNSDGKPYTTKIAKSQDLADTSERFPQDGQSNTLSNGIKLKNSRGNDKSKPGFANR